MIIADGTHLLVSRKEGQTCRILFPAITVGGEVILAMAVNENSFALGESYTSDNAEDEDVDITPVEFAQEAAALGITNPVMVALVPENKSVALLIPEGSEWKQIVADGSKLIIAFDDNTVGVADNFHPKVAPDKVGVVTQYANYALHNDALPNTYDLFNAETGELIQNVSI